jgi:Zn-finger nucleic acid-binding protein
MKCPHCSKSTSDVGKKCVHCGKDIQESIERTTDVPVKCPICNISTEIIDLAGVELDYCYKCTGIWFDKGEINKFQDAISDKRLCSEIAATIQELSDPNRKTKRTEYVKCPVCSLPMLHKKFVQISDIVLDRCADHGTWTEQEDLIKILEIIESGKIDELIARAASQDQKKLNERLKKIEAKQSQLNTELLRVSKFSKAHFFLDLIGFT